jgi:hypothetical protein
MKKLLVILFASLAMTQGANAKFGILDHLTIGANVGTPGIGADVAMPVTKFFDVQAGFSIMPHFKYTTNVHTNLPLNEITAYLPINTDDIPVQGKLKMVNGKVMINFMPLVVSSFHITVGAYFGGSDVIEVYNKNEGQLLAISEANQVLRDNGLPEIGLKMGDYLLTPDAQGNVKATLKTKSFKPYVGIGFGRGVVKHKPIGFKVDLGVMFWGTPTVVDHNGAELTKQDWDNKDGGIFKTISKFKVYPVLNFRLCGKIF